LLSVGLSPGGRAAPQESHLLAHLFLASPSVEDGGDEELVVAGAAGEERRCARAVTGTAETHVKDAAASRDREIRRRGMSPGSDLTSRFARIQRRPRVRPGDPAQAGLGGGHDRPDRIAPAEFGIADFACCGLARIRNASGTVLSSSNVKPLDGAD